MKRLFNRWKWKSSKANSKYGFDQRIQFEINERPRKSNQMGSNRRSKKEKKPFGSGEIGGHIIGASELQC